MKVSHSSAGWAALAIAFSAMSIPAAVQAQATIDKVKQRGWINVGYRPGAAPFSLTDAKGQPAGYALDFCAAITEKLKAATGVTEVRFVPTEVDKRLRLVKEGSLDMLCDSTTDTAERRATVDFSMPIFVDAVQVMVRTKDGISKIDQLQGKQVVAIGTTTAPTVLTDYATKKNVSWQLSKAVSAEAALGQLQLGWSQGYARDGVLLASQKAASSSSGDYMILPDRLSSEPIAIAFRKGDVAMRKLVDGAITEAMQTGAMQTYYDKWFIKAVPPAKPLGIPMSDDLKMQIAKSK